MNQIVLIALRRPYTFVVMSILWGWQVEGLRPDRFDVMGGAVCLVGVAIIMYWPRG